jgi:hypothetical protein
VTERKTRGQVAPDKAPPPPPKPWSATVKLTLVRRVDQYSSNKKDPPREKVIAAALKWMGKVVYHDGVEYSVESETLAVDPANPITDERTNDASTADAPEAAV